MSSSVTSPASPTPCPSCASAREGAGDGDAYFRPGVVLDGRVSLSAGGISGRRFVMLGDGSLPVLEVSGTYEDAADGFFYSERWTAEVDNAREGALVMPDGAQVLELALRRAGAPVQAQLAPSD